MQFTHTLAGASPEGEGASHTHQAALRRRVSDRSNSARNADVDPVSTIRPCSERVNTPAAAWARRNGARRLVAIVRSQSWIPMSESSASTRKPAHTTRASRRAECAYSRVDRLARAVHGCEVMAAREARGPDWRPRPRLQRRPRLCRRRIRRCPGRVATRPLRGRCRSRRPPRERRSPGPRVLQGG